MPPKIKKIYQIKITLSDSKPPIWRRILVPSDFSFWELHVAIQDAMGWMDCHLHHFVINNGSNKKTGIFGQSLPIFIGIPDDEGYTKPGWKRKISSYLKEKGQKITYEYDFGDGWEHIILLEEVLPADANLTYPKCIAGKRACPPEDCGGVWGYEHLLEVIKNPSHEDYEHITEWLEGDFDPDHFKIEEIKFENAKDRLEEKKSWGAL